jgi:hypothetical protein
MADEELDPAAITAELDQIGAGLRSFASPLFEFFNGLLAQGFHDDEAFILTRDYFNHMLENADDQDDD